MVLPTVDELERTVAVLMGGWRVLDVAVRVEWNDKLTTTAGRAFQQQGRIELNPTLLARSPEHLPMVLTHEAAHIAAFRLFGANIPAHGRHWRSLMRHAGHEPAVTHDIPVDDLVVQRRAAIRRRRFVYLRVCDACGDRMLVATVRYGRCGACDGRDSFLVMKAPAGPRGEAALLRLSLAEVRAAFGRGEP